MEVVSLGKMMERGSGASISYPARSDAMPLRSRTATGPFR